MLLPSPLSFSRRPHQRAFTLIELLVVVAIIGILAAISVPVFNSVRVKGIQLKCSANLKQWGAAVLAYAGDNNGQVQWKGWPSIGGNERYYEQYFSNGNKNSPSMQFKGKTTYYTEIFRYCPSEVYTINTGNAPVSYVMSRPNPPISNVGYFLLSQVTTPSQLVLMMDATGSENITGTDGLTSYVKPITLNNTQLRHGGLINVLFCDGHVTGYRWSELDPNVTNNQAQKDRLNNYWFQVFPPQQ